jgi:hypothetical protein
LRKKLKKICLKLGLTSFKDVRIATLRNFPFEAKVHLNYAETVLPIEDRVPKLKDFPAAIGGSGATMPE